MMHVTSNLTPPSVVGEKRTKSTKKDLLQPSPQDSRKVSSFIQRFYLFGTNTSTPNVPEADPEAPRVKKPKAESNADVAEEKRDPKTGRSFSAESSNSTTSSSDGSKESSPVQFPSYSVQRLRQFWNNRLLAGSSQPAGSIAVSGGASIDTLVRKTKSATIGAPTGVSARTVLRKSPSPKAISRFQRNGSIGRSGRRRFTLDSPDAVRSAGPEPYRRGSVQAIGQAPKRSSHVALLSPERETAQQLVEKRPCVGSPGRELGVVATPSPVPSVRDSFPLAISTPTGCGIHWARRTELLGIRAQRQEDKRPAAKMPLREENYVNSFIDVDIQSVPGQNEAIVENCSTPDREMSESTPNAIGDVPVEAVPEEQRTPARSANSSSLGRKGNTPTRKISFLNNISPYNRKLLACNGTKVAALTNKFNQMVQQDAGLLEQVKRRGGYIHKFGNVAYKVLENGSGSECGVGFPSASRNSSGRASLRKKNSNASVTSNRTDESSDEVSSASSKNASLRKASVKERPHLRRNLHRRPDHDTRSSLGVRKVLEIFEPNLHNHDVVRGRRTETGRTSSGHGDTGKPPPGRSKPKVPDKNEHVLMRTKEVKLKKARPASNDSGTVLAVEGDEILAKGKEVEPVQSETPEGTSERNEQSVVDEVKDIVEESVVDEANDSLEKSVVDEAKDSLEQSVVDEPTQVSSCEEPQAIVEEPQPQVVAPVVEEDNAVQKQVEAKVPLPLVGKETISPPKEVDKKKKKSTVSKIYDRLTFRLSKKSSVEATNPAEKPVEIVLVREENDRPVEVPANQIVHEELSSPIQVETPSENDTSEQKILEALTAVSQKIDNLSKSFNDLSISDVESPRNDQEKDVQPPVTGEQVVRPNTSFLFRGLSTISNSEKTSSKHTSQRNIVEAVNTVVINKAVSMDDHHFPCSRGSSGRMSLRDSENEYEAVMRPVEERPTGPGTIFCSTPTITFDLTELTTKINSFVHKSKLESENIYQSIPRKGGSTAISQLIPEDTMSVNSYESFENYESIEADTEGQKTEPVPREEDTYEICSPPVEMSSVSRGESRNDLTLPQPKRNLSSSPKTLPKHLQVTYQSNYERIKYGKIPLRPPKPEEVPLPPRNSSSTAMAVTGGSLLNVTLESISSIEPVESPGEDLLDKSSHGLKCVSPEDNIYEENIYDTIQSADGVDYDDPASVVGSAELDVNLLDEPRDQQTYTARSTSSTSSASGSLRPPHAPPADTVSLVSSNCYESIVARMEIDRSVAIMGHGVGGSTTTLASDQITNSLYGTTAGLASLTPPSERGSDTSNSAEWTDISDEDDVGRSDGPAGANGRSGRPKFIVVRERKRTHQTPLRSRKLARTAHSKIDDDSDHYYESLYSTHSNERSRPRIPSESAPEVRNDHPPVPDDEFDSFDSEDTDEGEYDDDDDERNRARTDSGVDIRNAKLPDPPTSNNQVQVFMQKIRRIGTRSRFELAKGLNKLSKLKPAKEHATYENAPKPKPTPAAKGSSRSLSKLLPLGTSAPKPPPEDYEGRPGAPTGSPLPLDSSQSCSSDCSAFISSPGVPVLRSTSESSNVSGPVPPTVDAMAARKKSKSSKSLRSKFRQSFVADVTNLNIGSSFNGPRSTFYVTSADVDSGIFNGSEGTPTGPSATTAKPGGLGQRPTIPPPPPPPVATEGGKTPNRKLGTTSWYDECSVFKPPGSVGSAGSDQSLSGAGKERLQSPRNGRPPKDALDGERTSASGTTWFSDIYQTSGASVASSSESSGVSTGGEGGPGDDHSHSMFVNEPLYQIYNAAKLEAITRDIDAELSGRSETELYDDGYEKIAERRRQHQAEAEADETGSCNSSSSEGYPRKPSRPTALELIEPHVGKLRTLWCEVPEVRISEILATLTPTEKRLQEAKFEILTSEASYLKSLNLLRTHFVNHPAFRDTRVLSAADRKTLFSSIIPVQECSDRLLCDLENCWQDNIMLTGLSHSIHKHAEKHFHVYVTYCEHQAKIDRTLKALKTSRPEFAQVLAELEANPKCCSLSLSSFLMLPMQRITRMRLLLDAVLQRCDPRVDDEFRSWEGTFLLINRILTQCNDAAHRSEQLHEMELLSRQIEFPTAVRPLAIVPCGIGAAPSTMHRKLEKRGELVHLLWRGDDAKLTFGKKVSKSSVYAFLFTDLLVLTKKKSDESYLVIDYCQRALLTVSSGDIVPGLPAKEMQAFGRHLIIMTLLENHEGKMVEMLLTCPSESERERWLMVTMPPASENPDERIYEMWDCPQVIAVHPYQALQPDELDLDIKDVVNVHRKMADGWYEGERIRDGAVGWFPSNHTKEIPSAHIRAKHIKQRHLLLTYTSKYIDTATKYQHYQHGKK